MTLDEAIAHSEHKANAYEEIVENQPGISLYMKKKYAEHVEKHRQLVKWFRELKRYKELGYCGECISLKQATETLKDIKTLDDEPLFESLGVYPWNVLKELPRVLPEPKTGHWIYTDHGTWCCSECGGNPHKGTGFTPTEDKMREQWKNCNLCGARMEV